MALRSPQAIVARYERSRLGKTVKLSNDDRIKPALAGFQSISKPPAHRAGTLATDGGLAAKASELLTR